MLIKISLEYKRLDIHKYMSQILAENILEKDSWWRLFLYHISNMYWVFKKFYL